MTGTSTSLAAGIAALALLGLYAVEASAQENRASRFAGVATIYSADYSGATASGQRYDPLKLTAAHRTLPFGTRLVVTDPRTGRSVTVIVNDRGPFTKGRILDLSWAAAKALHVIDRGVFDIVATVE